MSELRDTGPLERRTTYRIKGEAKSGKPSHKKLIEELTAKTHSTKDSPKSAILRKAVTVCVGKRQSSLFDAIVDTGAVVSVIPKILVSEWNLQANGTLTATGYDGASSRQERYWVTLSLPDVSPKNVCVLATDRCDVLIGCDMLETCRFVYDGATGTYALYEQNLLMRFLCRGVYLFRRLRDRLLRRR
jgi:hypothetical protein